MAFASARLIFTRDKLGVRLSIAKYAVLVQM